jgi:hypothetical protein
VVLSLIRSPNKNMLRASRRCIRLPSTTAIIVRFDLWNTTRGLMLKVPLFYLEGYPIYWGDCIWCETCVISNKVGIISVLKKFVISSSTAPRSPVVLSATDNATAIYHRRQSTAPTFDIQTVYQSLSTV